MINRITGYIVRHKMIVISIFAILVVVCGIFSLGVDVNYNMVDYLPAESQSTVALEVMQDEFGGSLPNANVMIADVDITDALEYKNKLEDIEGIGDVIWLDDVMDVTVPIEMADTPLVENYYKDGNALFTVTIEKGYEKKAIDEIYDLIGDETSGNALTGIATSDELLKEMTASQSTTIMLFLIPIIIGILLFSTSSWFEPVLFLVTIGVAVVINMGTNALFGEVSYITQSVSPILQLAVSLDYAIFLLHSFEKMRGENHDPNEAMMLAVKRSFPAIAASAATTLFGFAALSFMKFGIGADLGINLVKGVLLSFISVTVFLPAFTLVTYKLIDKTRHKTVFPSFKNAGKFLVKLKTPALILLVVIIVPSFLGQNHNSFMYGSGSLAQGNRLGSETKRVNEIFGRNTPVVLLVPKGDVVRENMLAEQLEKENPEITSVVSYASAVGTKIPPEYLDDNIVSNFYSDNYARIIINADTGSEGEDTFAFIEKINNTTKEYYGDDFYSLGESVALYDIKETITADTAVVNLIAIGAIFLVILISFKSLTFPLLLILTIEAAIWVNLSIPYFMGSELNYVGFLVISTVQLGATVDYAILLAENYSRNRKVLAKLPAIKLTLTECVGSIFISSSVLTAAGFCLMLISTNLIISQLGLLLGRGTIMSVISVICILPALLLVFDKAIAKTTLKSKFVLEEHK